MDGSLLAGWENFYVIIGSSAGGLTGLTFVVIALLSDVRRVQPAGVGVFLTPTIVHFAGVLALAAFLSMPHQSVATLSVAFALAGLAGLGYAGFIAAHMPRRGGEYTPVAEDWLWHVVLPTLMYGGLLLMAGLMWHHPAHALYGVATVSLVLLFIGIHNAWDTAVWISFHRGEPG